MIREIIPYTDNRYSIIQVDIDMKLKELGFVGVEFNYYSNRRCFLYAECIDGYSSMKLGCIDDGLIKEYISISYKTVKDLYKRDDVKVLYQFDTFIELMNWVDRGE